MGWGLQNPIITLSEQVCCGNGVSARVFNFRNHPQRADEYFRVII